jgi:hypothetical protein
MTKKQLQKIALEKDREEREFMQSIEANKEGDWMCGILARYGEDSDTIFGIAKTEADAERYMKLRSDRNGGIIPHRLFDQVGWWNKKIVR